MPPRFGMKLPACLALAFIAACGSLFAGDVVVRQETVNLAATDDVNNWEPKYVAIQDWLTQITGKGYQLLYKNATADAFTAVLVDDKGRLVVAIHLFQEPGTFHTSFAVTAADGSSAIGDKQYDNLKLSYKITAPSTLVASGMEISTASREQEYVEGQIYNVKQGFTGPLHILRQDWKKKKHKNTILDCTIQWPAPKPAP